MIAPDREWLSGRLWSLLDMVKRIESGQIILACANLSRLSQFLKDHQATRVKFDPSVHVRAKSDANRALQECVNLGLRQSKKAAEELLRLLNVPDLSEPNNTLARHAAIGAVVTQIDDLLRRIADEMADCHFYEIAGGKAELLDPSGMHFGKSVFDAFPGANEDIYEACACFALGRYTACVMHLMRVLEVGLKSLAKAIGVPSQNDWGSYIREIGNELDARVRAAGKRTPDEQFYAEVAFNFDRLRRAYRNPTMHVDKSYSEDRASEIMASVQSFMIHLSTRVSE